MRVRRHARAIQLAASLLAVAAGGGCGLFEPRDPVSPPPAVSGCRSLTSVDAAIANIQDFYGSFDGLTCYTDLIDSTFTFHPDPLDEIEAPPGTYDGWDAAVERGSASRLALGADSVAARFVSQYQPVQIPDIRTEIRFYDYTVGVRPVAAATVLHYSGQAELTFRKGNDSQWRLGDWVDHRVAAGDSTWGRLRRDNK